MGASYRAYLDRNGLADPAHCPDGVLIRADSDERTVMTAHGLGSGLANTTNKTVRCGFAIHEVANGIDPLFHPSEAMPERCPLNPKDVEAAVSQVARLSTR
jgi:hypothetical protein